MQMLIVLAVNMENFYLKEYVSLVIWVLAVKAVSPIPQPIIVNCVMMDIS